MADLKISQLTALVAADVVGTDVFPIVDTSATTTKKISLADVTEFVNDAIVFPAGVEDLDDLGDVAAPSPSAGDVLQYNGSAWVNASSSDDQFVLSAAIFTS
jgi:hypothetical protein